MRRSRRTTGWVALLLLGLHAGCADLAPTRSPGLASRATVEVPGPADHCPPAAPAADRGVVLVSATEPAADPGTTSDPKAAADPKAAPPSPPPFKGKGELQVEALIEAVLARNPTLAQMTAAWQAASARYPQVTSLDDPMLSAAFGPATIGSPDVNFAYRLEVSQKYPWCGKLALRGENALAQASAAGHDVEDVRLQLVESTRTAFYDYYLAERALEVNKEALRLLKEFRENAETRYRTGQAPQQDLLQADVEIGRQRERQLTLERMKRVAVARINTLMHLPTGSPLPPPPGEIEPAGALPDVRELQGRAVALRPDLKALAARIAAEKASLGLAFQDYYPDLEPYFMYDRFMGNTAEMRDLAPQLGLRLNLPVRKARREGAVAEAMARLAERQAELARLTDQVNLQVEEAYQQARESERAVRLYDQTILPSARENVKAAITAYATGKVPFLSLIEAERNLVGLRDRFYETSADVFRRRAALERAVGGPLSPAPAHASRGGELPPPGRLPPTDTQPLKQSERQ